MAKQVALTKLGINDLLKRNNRACERALVVLFERQTGKEQTNDTTSKFNRVGFNIPDAKIFSSFARQVLAGRRLTARQLAVCRLTYSEGTMKLGKYWWQLIEIAKEKRRNRKPSTGGRV